MTDWNHIFNYCNKKETLADAYNDMCGAIMFKLAKRQTDWLYMASETGRKPKVKSLNTFCISFEEAFREAIELMHSHTRVCLLFWYIYQDIDIDEESEEYLRETFDIDPSVTIKEFAMKYLNLDDTEE